MDTEGKLVLYYLKKKSSNSTEPYFVNEKKYINIIYYIDH